MNSETDSVKEIFRQLAKVRVEFKSIARTLRKTIVESTVTHAMDLVDYDSRTVLEMFIEVALPEARSLCWWFDVELIDNVWRIEASLRKCTGDGEDEVWLKNFEDSAIASLWIHLHDLLCSIHREVKGGLLEY